MRRSFWKAASISLGAYTVSFLMGLWGDFRLTFFAVLALQGTWTLFCAVRILQLRSTGGHQPDALEHDRKSYGFALGGAFSSIALLAIFVVLTQVV